MTNATTSILSAALAITQSLSSINDRISDIEKTASGTESVSVKDVSFYRNRETAVHGNLFGSQQGMAIGIDDGWGEAAEKQW